ncbi:hypothetical protein BC936DRAFT_143034 [Jimgerdemannia flammicorona]|uniref:Uncharacterized protein n=1 Tax=Jimgerdemannia flammicorona TaxID=994334 RepID=A0A432ZZE6_9FUNG|nr:hypothetical protein BC936DRAFT_143034 [Jimgerdemannia flammicorona]
MDQFTLPHRILKKLNCARFWSQRYVYWDKDSVWNAFYRKDNPIATNDQCFAALEEDVEILFRYFKNENKRSNMTLKIASIRQVSPSVCNLSLFE